MSDTIITHTEKDSGVPAFARDFSVTDRIVIITGGGQGLGREFARQFAAAGAIPVIADINEQNARAVAEEITAAGGKAMPIAVDVSNKESVDAMAAAVVKQFGRIDVLVNNASIFATLQKRPFDQIPVSEWETVLKVNVTGVFLCTCAVLASMREQGWGRVVSIASDAVPKGVANYLHYVASKAAVIGMTNSMARELGASGITVNAIRPGAVATEVDRTVNHTVEARKRIVDMQCIPRVMVPTDLVGLVMFLCTPAAAFITGQTIACDGGYTHSS
ncbi:short-chain dehydrogenase (plasmid) [Cupriavidus necator]|uniref:Short-chain dehydrogenase n=1 Tax=Cupriavidus necator TaxID=106590 RepID=A0A1U9V2V8_CUPNE|nr:SDR family oxidoreductase [Cupriavidus necator]AQV99233.1 short-chain dehydrogenase [Cupriavidus necator]